jgi:hypothetical protein
MLIKKISSQLWFPFWIDKWIFGSMRLEFGPAERALWVDLLSLAGKDDGYIRANEETPYPAKQLAGMLVYDEDFVAVTIEQFIKKGKLSRLKTGVLHITNWDKYRLADSYKRVLKHRQILPDETKVVSDETKNITQIKSNHIKSNHIKTIKADNTGQLFEEFWASYPREGRFHKKACGQRFAELVKGGHLDDLKAGFAGYLGFLKHKELNENFKQQPLHVMTFLNKERYATFKGYKYEPRL